MSCACARRCSDSTRRAPLPHLGGDLGGIDVARAPARPGRVAHLRLQVDDAPGDLGGEFDNVRAGDGAGGAVGIEDIARLRQGIGDGAGALTLAARCRACAAACAFCCSTRQTIKAPRPSKPTISAMIHRLIRRFPYGYCIQSQR